MGYRGEQLGRALRYKKTPCVHNNEVLHVIREKEAFRKQLLNNPPTKRLHP